VLSYAQRRRRGADNGIEDEVEDKVLMADVMTSMTTKRLTQAMPPKRLMTKPALN
jgi:hypothetical protein